MKDTGKIIRVAVDVPLRKLFDYLPPNNFSPQHLQAGTRVTIPFGKKNNVTGVIIETTERSSIAPDKLKRIITILDEEPVIDQKLLKFYLWAAAYYQHPPGEVIVGNLPARLRRGLSFQVPETFTWKAANIPDSELVALKKKAPKQARLYQFIKTFPAGVDQDALRKHFVAINATLTSLENKQLITREKTTVHHQQQNVKSDDIKLRPEQQHAVDQITGSLGHYGVYSLNGITGSGKTEVYIESAKKVIQSGKQVLVLVPEIGLTPQLIARFSTNLNTDIAVIHSALNDQERMDAWIRCGNGTSSVLIGTRSSIWTPFNKLGLVIVDEEHDLSYKQQDGFRYSARDLVIVRARSEAIPVILGSATPSLETIFNVNSGRYQECCLLQRNDNVSLPDIHLLDIRNQPMDAAISKGLQDAIRRNLELKQQVLVFLNRRGFAPVILCHDCGWTHRCPRCDIQMTYHKTTGKQVCHHCQHQEKVATVCPECNGSELIQVGSGTQRIHETLEQLFPTANILRIDRDSTRRKGSMENMLNQIHDGQIDILVGTQMITKGHHFPDLTLVGIIDVDRGLCSNDFRASERMGQLILQVSGRAGRAEKPGKVILQTHFPDHPLLDKLQHHDYTGFSTMLLAERKSAGLPPYSHQVMLRAEAKKPELTFEFLQKAGSYLRKTAPDLEIFGPFSAPIAKRAGLFRVQLLIQSTHRNSMRKYIENWLDYMGSMPQNRKIRWSIDVDPQEML